MMKKISIGGWRLRENVSGNYINIIVHDYFFKGGVEVAR